MRQSTAIEYNPLTSLFGNDFMEAENGDARVSIPAIRIKEEKKNYKIEMTIPGFRKEDFSVLVTDNMLTVSCKKASAKIKSNQAGFPNTDYTRFTRLLALPDNADGNKVKAKYNGILKLVVAKKAGEKK
jgi:HSP20 family protein